MKVFQYIVIWHPAEEQKKNGQKDVIVVDVHTVLAKDQTSAMLIAAKNIPEDYMDSPEQLEVVVRPF